MGCLVAAKPLLDAPGLDWVPGPDGTFSCAVVWHGEAGALLLEPEGPGPATLSLIGARGVLWTRPLEEPLTR
jgi:hypothetical protein